MTAIKKESEVAKVTTLADTDCVRVTLANGQSASIKKSDLMPIIKDEIGKLLGNTDALSTFTNVLVNNGQTLGKATIENLASVVSGANIQIWGIGQNDKDVLWGSYTICVDGITIPSISLDTLWGAGLSILSGNYIIQLIVTNHINAVRWGELKIFSKDWHLF